MVREIMLDMDGVLCDFVGGICAAHGRTDPWADGKNRGRDEIAPLWGITEESFYARCNYTFWANLEKTPEADEIVELCEKTVGAENVCILSAGSRNYAVYDGKLEWIRRHFPQFKRRYLFGPQKKFCVAPGRALIDDRDKNIDAWSGLKFLMPRPWNKSHLAFDEGFARTLMLQSFLGWSAPSVA